MLRKIIVVLLIFLYADASLSVPEQDTTPVSSVAEKLMDSVKSLPEVDYCAYSSYPSVASLLIGNLPALLALKNEKVYAGCFCGILSPPPEPALI